MPIYSLPQSFAAHTTTWDDLREGSPDILDVVLPTSDAELVAQGWPSIAGAVDGDLWLCDEAAGNLVGKINGYQLAPQNAPLQGRRFQGLPYGGTLWAKAAVEGVASNQRFAATVAGNCEVGLNDFTISALVRTAAYPPPVASRLAGKRNAAVGWELICYAGNTQMGIQDAGGYTGHIGPALNWDASINLITIAVDRNGNVSFYLNDAATINVAALRPGDLTVADAFSIVGTAAGAFGWIGQVSWSAIWVGVPATRAGHDALYSRLVQWSYPTDQFSYKARAGRITVPIGYQPGVGQLVATYASGQPAHSWSRGAKVDQADAGTTLPLNWRQPVVQNTPPARYAPGLCYDSLRRQLLMFGGTTGAYLNDTWLFDLTSQEWTQVSSGGPSARATMVLVYDPVRDRVVLFGGLDAGGVDGETWEWNPATRQWTQMAPVASPTARSDCAATYDVVRQRVLIFGGFDGAVRRRETYEYDGATWTLVSSTGPTVRSAAMMAYDPVQDRTLLFGGWTGAACVQETWSWNGGTATWADLAPATQPTGRCYHGCWYDSVRQQVYVAYGQDSVGTALGDTWSYDWTGNTWTQRASEGAAARIAPGLTYDVAHGVAVLFGGFTAAGSAADTWTYGRAPLGLVAPRRGTFLGISSNNINGWTNDGLVTHTQVDGPSGIRDAVRILMGALPWNPGAGGENLYNNAAAPLTGASNVPFIIGARAKRATVNQSFRLGYYIAGDPGGAESGTVYANDAMLIEWMSYSGSVVPVGAAHNTFWVRAGAALAADNVDFAEPYAVQGTDQVAPYYLRTGTTSETVAAQSTLLAGGRWCDPTRFHLLLRLHGAPGATERMGERDETLWRSIPIVDFAGEVWIRCRPDLQVMLIDAYGYTVGTYRTGYVLRAGNDYEVDIVWDAFTPLPVLSAIGTDRVAIMINGTYTCSGQATAWTPQGVTGIAGVKALNDN